MKILVTGSDGFIGFCLVQNLLKRGHTVYGMDAFFRRKMVNERYSTSMIPIASPQDRVAELMKLGNFNFLECNIATEPGILEKVYKDFLPDVVINLAQMPAAPYSMVDMQHGMFTIQNNVLGLHNILWLMRNYTPRSSLVTLGTMGEWGTPNLPIAEGFFKVEYEGMTDIIPFPRQTNSIYHCSKQMGGDLCWMACRIWELKVTEIQQGIVYGTRASEMQDNPLLKTRLDVDESFGTMINRAVASAIIEHPILLYGAGSQIRAYIALRDSIACLTLAAENPPDNTDSHHGYRVINQFDESYSCEDVAQIVKEVAKESFDIDATIKNVANPRVESEVHYYNPKHEKLYKMGWKPQRTIREELVTMFNDLIPNKDLIEKYKHVIDPTITWKPKRF